MTNLLVADKLGLNCRYRNNANAYTSNNILCRKDLAISEN